MKRLEDHADIVAAIARQSPATTSSQDRGRCTSTEPERRAVETGEQIQQRGFSRARLPQQRDEFAGLDGQRDAVNRANHAAAHGVVAADILGSDGRALTC